MSLCLCARVRACMCACVQCMAKLSLQSLPTTAPTALPQRSSSSCFIMPQLLKLQQQLNCILIFHNTSKIKFHSSFYSLFLFLLLHFICLRRRPLLTFTSICLVRGAACACVVCANECVFVRMCVCVCCLTVCMQSIANVEEKQQLQHTFRHTNMHTHVDDVSCLFMKSMREIGKMLTN